MRKSVTALNKSGRLAIVAVLCFDVYGCGMRVGRDLSMAGAVQKFDQRRAATRAQAAIAEAAENGEDLTSRALKNIKPLPPRRELLQVRVPQVIEVDDIADGVIAGSISTPISAPGTSTVSLTGSNATLRALDTQMRALDKRIELTRRDRRAKQAEYDAQKLTLDQMDMRHSKARDLLLQEFKISYEKMLQETLAEVDTLYNEAEPATVLGLSDNNEFGMLAMFGRNELARPDEYVSLDKSFLFVGNDMTTGVALGRMDDLAVEVGSRSLSVNLAGLRLPTALRSLARAIGLQIYLSPEVAAATDKISLEIDRADALDVFDILIDNYDLALAYDRKMGVARFYTKTEFGTRVEEAITTAQVHNRRARNFRRVSSLEDDAAAIRQVYMAYFQNPDDAGRARALTNDAIVETERSPIIADAIVKLKEAALANEKKLDELDVAHSEERQTQLAATQLARFNLDDVNQALLMLGQDKLSKQEQLSEVTAQVELAKAEAETKKTSQTKGAEEEAPELAEMGLLPDADETAQDGADPVQRFLSGPGADVLRGRVLADANLKTSEPVFTEKFTIYNSEGANSCSGEAGDRVAGIKEELENYFGQLYPDEIIAAERSAEREAVREKQRRERLAAEAARREAEALEQAGRLDTSLASNNVADIASDAVPGIDAPSPAANLDGVTILDDNLQAPGASAPQASTNNQGDNQADNQADNEAATEEEAEIALGFTDSSFRRPSVTAVAETVIITGFKRDVDLAASLIESLDKADKQVLVEVFMVNVVKNWKRQLQGRLENIERTPAKTDSDISDLPISVREDYPDLVEVRDGGLVGVRGAINFVNRVQNANYFALNNFRLGLAWTIDFMETNNLGRKVSSPTILALNGCSARIEKKETRLLYTDSTTNAVVTPGATIPGSTTSTPSERTASLALSVTPTINPLNDHVRLKIDFKDDFFVSASADSDKIESSIQTEFVAAPGDVIVLAGLYTEDNSRTREGLPGTTSLPLITSLMGSSTESKSNQEMVIFLAPEVITPRAGEMPVNSAAYYEQQ